MIQVNGKSAPLPRCGQRSPTDLSYAVSTLGMILHWVPAGEPIPGSYWGAPEAGLIGNRLYVRSDTPLHSLLHELCHWLCMDEARRATLHTDAGGCDTEENAVCYLQVRLAERLPDYGAAAMFADMDAWGYHFRLGSAQAWFEQDAEDAIAWLKRRGLLDAQGNLCLHQTLPRQPTRYPVRPSHPARAPMATVYRALKNNRFVTKRYAMRHPDKVKAVEKHPSPTAKKAAKA